ILTITLIIGYLGLGNALYLGGDDIAFDRLDKIDIPESLAWYYVLPPLVLMLITRIGIPVSTTFMILTFFSAKSLPGMVQKSIMGYLIAFGAAIIIYMITTRILEKKFLQTPIDLEGDNTIWTNRRFWTVAQWCSTGFLWAQWLTQDLANIYVYIGKDDLSIIEFIFSLTILVGLLGYIFYLRGGKIQDIVRSKTNTADIRAATFVDLIYGIVLLVFKQNILGLWDAKLPMSTTWVFIGLLAGREIAIAYQLHRKVARSDIEAILRDLWKVFLGLIVSVALVYVIKFLSEL
ncbi:MAG: hypothetical protein R3250_11610, partial [Melioribacteraceae bacterium]|nr:hypothetical protein [Melioribacteraceae bacterium]